MKDLGRPIEPVRRGGARHALVAWLGGLSLVAGVAIAGRVSSTPPSGPALASAAAPAAAARTVGASPATSRSPVTLVPSTVLVQPSSRTRERGDGTLEVLATTSDPTVRAVDVALQADGRTVGRGRILVSGGGSAHGWLRFATSLRRRAAMLHVVDADSRRPLAETGVTLDPADPIVIETPALPYRTVSGRTLRTEGWVRMRSEPIEVRLEDRDGRVLARADAVFPRDTQTTAALRRFVADLRLPQPLPSGAAWIVAAPTRDTNTTPARLPVVVG